jgi:hypothetical protein
MYISKIIDIYLLYPIGFIVNKKVMSNDSSPYIDLNTFNKDETSTGTYVYTPNIYLCTDIFIYSTKISYLRVRIYH